jgi:hypothetical protein
MCFPSFRQREKQRLNWKMVLRPAANVVLPLDLGLDIECQGKALGPIILHGLPLPSPQRSPRGVPLLYPSNGVLVGFEGLKLFVVFKRSGNKGVV